MHLFKGKKAIVKNVEVANSFSKRVKGLIGRTKISKDYALYIPGCNFIHTFFMKAKKMK